MFSRTAALAAMLALFAANAAAADPARDAGMQLLAAKSGCLACHAIETGANSAKGPDSVAPAGPAWRDVAAKYQGRQGASAQLTRTVLTGSNPYDSHWKGKAAGVAMPPNAVAIPESDAKKLVAWILSFETKKP